MRVIILIALIGITIGYLYGVETSMKATEKMLILAILGGLVITIISPFIRLYQFLRNLVMRLISLFCPKQRSDS